ncbi:MAG: type 1 glutamine amidotransferase domain-containing protein [Leptospiraceae bacterium]|nr:type 1 glutamine amidotransferase domain-containing protein [Leptospiraceae bacterium]
MNKKLKIGIGILGVILIVTLLAPNILHALGFHRHYEIPPFDLKGKRALVITTSHDKLYDPANPEAPAKPTGVAGSEMTIPYYAFLDAGLEVDLASIKGGKIPIDPLTIRWPIGAPEDSRFQKDAVAMSKLNNSIPITKVDLDKYDVIFLSGGWGAAYDYEQSPELADLVTKANEKDIVIGSVCHGALGLVNAKDKDGSPLIKNRAVTGVTDKQLKDFGIYFTPRHPETELRKAQAKYESESTWLDFFATHVSVDGQLVTGQNQNSSAEASHRILEILAKK